MKTYLPQDQLNNKYIEVDKCNAILRFQTITLLKYSFAVHFLKHSRIYFPILLMTSGTLEGHDSLKF